MGKLSLIGQVLIAVEGDREWHVHPSKFLMICKLSYRSLLNNNLFFLYGINVGKGHSGHQGQLLTQHNHHIYH